MELPHFSKTRRKVTHFSRNLHHPFTIFSIIYPLSPPNPKITPPYHGEQSRPKTAPLRTTRRNPAARSPVPSVLVAAILGCPLPSVPRGATPRQEAPPPRFRRSHAWLQVPLRTTRRNPPARRRAAAFPSQPSLAAPPLRTNKGPAPRRGPFPKASATEVTPIRARNDTGGPPSAAHGSCAIRTRVPRCRAASRGRWPPCLPWSHRCPLQPPSFAACRAPGADASG